MKTINVIIEGTHCNACKLLIEDVSKEIKGVTSCKVDFQTGKTVIEHDGNFNLGLFKKEIESLGQYKVKINQ
jgi:copper chaperone CopZ